MIISSIDNERIAGSLAGADAIRALLVTVDRTRQEQEGWARVLLEFRVHAGRDPELNRRYAANVTGVNPRRP